MGEKITPWKGEEGSNPEIQLGEKVEEKKHDDIIIVPLKFTDKFEPKGAIS